MSLIIENLSKSFNRHPVLEHINLTIHEHDIVVLMGESGSGKTTLVRCLCHLETPDSGKIIMNGNVLFDQGQRKAYQYKDIGMVFQNHHLFPHRTVLQNICDAPIYHRLMSSQEAKEKARKLLKKLHLEDKEDAYPYTLSGGQKQRVAIARACILQPKILCFDEPTSALDQNSIERLTKIIQELKENMAILIITHDTNFGKAIGTHLYDIHEL